MLEASNLLDADVLVKSILSAIVLANERLLSLEQFERVALLERMRSQSLPESSVQCVRE